MAIARQIDPAALARAFADEMSAIPEVKRLWYRYRPNSFNPERMSLDFNILLAQESDTADVTIADALARLQTEYFDELSVGAFQFTHPANDVLTLDELVSSGAIELPLREV